jgi:protein ImuA
MEPDPSSWPNRGSIARRNPGEAPTGDGSLLPFAIPGIDRVLAGGLRRDAIHEIRGAVSREAAAATGFAAAILVCLAQKDDRPVLWISEKTAAREAGIPYGAGLASFGLDYRRLIVVRVKKARDVLWTAEEGLACRGLSAVVAEIRGQPRQLDLTASRRLALRANAVGVMGLLVRQTDRAEPSAAATRWLIAPRPATTVGGYPAGIGRPAWRLTLERNRRGTIGVFDVEWDHGRCCFVSADAGPLPAYPFRIFAVPFHRSHPPSGHGALVA